MVNVKDIAITKLETISGFGITSGDYLFTLDELQNATLSQGQETSDITGKNGRKIATLKKNKTVTISGSNGLVSGGLLEMQTGGTFENKETEVLWTDYLTVSDNSATTTYKAVGTTGAEIEGIYVKNADGTLGTELTQAATTASGKFAYSPSTKALTFTDIDDGTEVVVLYKRKITADVLENESDVYSTKCQLYIDAIGEDTCANEYRVQIYIPKADFSGEFSLELGNDQTVHEFEAESLAGGCGLGTNGALWTYTIFGVNTEDAA